MERFDTVMNEIMIGHRRNILAALGFDLWVPKDTLCQEKSSISIWRDQNRDDSVARINLVPDACPSTKFTEPAAKSVSHDSKSQNPAVEVASVLLPEFPLEQAMPVVPFSLQAFGLARCVVVAETTALTDQQQQLWFNILGALPSQYYELKWPFPLINLQDPRGVGSYIQGFLDAMSQDKSLISLGDLPYCQGSRITRLASLQEMLEQPLLKKRLWQFMQNNDEEMED